MTHADIYTKFMIEYDKANVTSSYPSLTEYEVATFLDKAYNALISQKVTGNNIRRTPFEADTKSVSDLQGLVKRENVQFTHSIDSTNVVGFNISQTIPDFLYFVNLHLNTQVSNPQDHLYGRTLQCKMVSHDMAQKFIVSASNIPWIKNPVCFIEDGMIFVVVDPI